MQVQIETDAQSQIPLTSYDVIGKYNQDAINGFDENFLDEFIEACQLKNETSFRCLDAMAGDGNLSERILRKYPNISMTVSDYSRIQCLEAKRKLGNRAEVRELDMINEHPYENEFNVIVIKSGSHEISLEKQAKLYRGIYKALVPGGIFVNLGILLDCPKCQTDINRLNEFRSLLANIPDDIVNRHFLLRDELYQILNRENFVDIRPKKIFHYSIDMGILAREYFQNDEEKRRTLNGLIVELKELRRRRLTELNDNWTVRMPGEITIAKKPL